MKVKNWRKFQHYKHRNPPWIRLYRDLLDDREWHNLDGEAAKILVMIWMIVVNSEGVLPPLSDLAFRLRMPEKQVASAISRLSHWLDSDASTSLADRYQNISDEWRSQQDQRLSVNASTMLADRYQVATTETETETETEKKEDAPRRARSRKVSIPYSWRPSGVLLTSKGEEELAKMHDWARSNAALKADWDATWRNWMRRAGGQCEEASANIKADIGFYAAFGSVELEAWDAHGRVNGINSPRDKRGGWYFPTRWPPDYVEHEAA